MLTVTNKDSNYLAKVVKLKEFTKHPNADKLLIWKIDGYEVITDNESYSVGTVVILFPVECQISDKILSKLNLYSDKELNSNNLATGYISKSRRVKAVKLRGIVSEGMVIRANQVLDEDKFGLINNKIYNWNDFVGTSFDTIHGEVICNKYVPPVNLKGEPNSAKDRKKKTPKLQDILVEGQFQFHYSTSKLQDNIWRFDNPNDTIVCTAKFHGTSAVFSNLLTNKKLSLWEKTKRFFGSNIPKLEYKRLYASRTVIKSIEDRFHSKLQGYYSTDIWGKVFEEIKDKLFPGYTIYGEIVGYVGEKLIQKDYDYGCKPGEHKFLVYRITETVKDGTVHEYPWNAIKDFCVTHGLEHVKELYYGLAGDLINYETEDLLTYLKDTYLEKDCQYCAKKVPAEGICIRNESDNMIAYKLKSKAFLAWETKQLDTGEEIVE